MSEKTEEMRDTIKNIHAQVNKLKRCVYYYRCKNIAVSEYDYCADCLDSMQMGV